MSEKSERHAHATSVAAMRRVRANIPKGWRGRSVSDCSQIVQTCDAGHAPIRAGFKSFDKSTERASYCMLTTLECILVERTYAWRRHERKKAVSPLHVE